MGTSRDSASSAKRGSGRTTIQQLAESRKTMMGNIDRPMGTLWSWDKARGCPQLMWQHAIPRPASPSSGARSRGPLGPATVSGMLS